MDVTDTPAAGRRSAALDGLRGYAAATVVIFHSILGPRPDLVTDLLYRGIQVQDDAYLLLVKLVLSVFSGEVAVAVFFVISGIVLLRSARGLHARTGSAWRTSWIFLVRRFLRIWPVMAVCLMAHASLFALVDVFWPGLIGIPSMEDLARNLVLADTPVNGATWTLKWELLGAPAILLCLLAANRFGRWAVLVPCVYALLGIVRYNGWLLHSVPLEVTLPFMMAGVAIESGWLAVLARPGLRLPVGLLALSVLAVTELFVPTLAAIRWHVLGMLVSVPVLVGLVHTGRQGAISRLLLARPSQFLGRISFSLYLLNVPIFELLLAVIDPHLPKQHPLEVGLVVGVVATALTAPIAHLAERWIEQPCIWLGSVLTSGRSADLFRPRPSLLR